MKLKELKVGDKFRFPFSITEYFVLDENTISWTASFGNGKSNSFIYLNEDVILIKKEEHKMKINELQVGDIFWMSGCIGNAEWVILEDGTFDLVVNKRSKGGFLFSGYMNREVKFLRRQTMNSLEAIQAMKDGKKVRYQTWNPNHYVYIKDNKVLNQNNSSDMIRVQDLNVSLWELYTGPAPVEVKLSKDYTAILSNTGIKVGCQDIPYSKLDEIVNASKKFREA